MHWSDGDLWTRATDEPGSSASIHSVVTAMSSLTSMAVVWYIQSCTKKLRRSDQSQETSESEVHSSVGPGAGLLYGYYRMVSP